MKLGLAVVYLVKPGEGDLLRAHLDMIRRHARLPYRIYASLNRAAPEFLPWLRSAPDIVDCALPTTPYRDATEHSCYLSGLYDAALADGVTHLCNFHLDSFPVRDGWDEDLVARLEQGHDFIAPPRTELPDECNPHSLCMFFRADLWRRYGAFPALPGQPTVDEAFATHRESRPWQETGDAFGYWIARDGLRWLRLPRSNVHCDAEHNALIYGDVVFHLGGINSGGPQWNVADVLTSPTALWRAHWRQRLGLRGERFLTEGMRRLLFPAEARRGAETARAMVTIQARLQADPQGYVDYLRGLGPPPPA